MKIVNKKQFITLPEGVLYTKFRPRVFGEICIKGKNSNNNLYYKCLLEVEAKNREHWDELVTEGMEIGNHIPLDFKKENIDDKCEDFQLFAVFEKEEVKQLVDSIQKRLSQYPII